MTNIFDSMDFVISVMTHIKNPADFSNQNLRDDA